MSFVGGCCRQILDPGRAECLRLARSPIARLRNTSATVTSAVRSSRRVRRAVGGTTRTGTGAVSASSRTPSRARRLAMPRVLATRQPSSKRRIRAPDGPALGPDRLRRPGGQGGRRRHAKRRVLPRPIRVDVDGPELDSKAVSQAHGEPHGAYRRTGVVHATHDRAARPAGDEAMCSFGRSHDHDGARRDARECCDTLPNTAAATGPRPREPTTASPAPASSHAADAGRLVAGGGQAGAAISGR